MSLSESHFLRQLSGWNGVGVAALLSSYDKLEGKTSGRAAKIGSRSVKVKVLHCLGWYRRYSVPSSGLVASTTAVIKSFMFLPKKLDFRLLTKCS